VAHQTVLSGQISHAEHCMNLGQCVQFQGTSILAMKFSHVECVIREAIESEINPET